LFLDSLHKCSLKQRQSYNYYVHGGFTLHKGRRQSASGKR